MGARKGGLGRSLAVGALLGILAVAAALAALLVGSGRVTLDWLEEPEPPSQLLVVAVTEDPDGVAVAGIVWRVSAAGDVEVLDPYLEVSIPGTTYSSLRDAYAFGGGEAVAQAYADASGSPALEWVVLPATEWQATVAEAGGVQVTVPESTNVFIADELYVIDQGEQTLGGDEVAALVSAEASVDEAVARRVNEGVGAAIARLVADSWPQVAAAVAAGDARSSLSEDALRRFGSDSSAK